MSILIHGCFSLNAAVIENVNCCISGQIAAVALLFCLFVCFFCSPQSCARSQSCSDSCIKIFSSSEQNFSHLVMLRTSGKELNSQGSVNHSIVLPLLYPYLLTFPKVSSTSKMILLNIVQHLFPKVAQCSRDKSTLPVSPEIYSALCGPHHDIVHIQYLWINIGTIWATSRLLNLT